MTQTQVPGKLKGEMNRAEGAEKQPTRASDAGMATAAAEPDMGRLIGDYGTGLLRMCFLYLKDRQLAEDAVQETYIRTYRGWSGFRGQCSEKTWIVGIAMNVCRSMLRSPWHRRVFCSDKPFLEAACARADAGSGDAASGAGAEPEAMLEDDTVLREIAALRPKYREVILLFYYQEMKTREIADLLGISESAVSVRLNRARGELRGSLKGWYLNE